MGLAFLIPFIILLQFCFMFLVTYLLNFCLNLQIIASHKLEGCQFYNKLFAQQERFIADTSIAFLDAFVNNLQIEGH